MRVSIHPPQLAACVTMPVSLLPWADTMVFRIDSGILAKKCAISVSLKVE
jgi:hypothetical protein